MKMRWGYLGWLLILAILQGCGGASKPTEASARAKVEAELKNWMAGIDSEASTLEARSNLHDFPISCSIRSMIPTEPRVPTEILVKYPDAIDDKAPAFRVIVDADFKSKVGTPLTKVIEYNVTWVNEMNDWAIGEKF